MALTKISRGLLNTGVSDSSDANAITISSAEKVTLANTLNAPTSIQTPLIEFTDGDDAIAIADGGAVTMAKVGAIGATTAGTGAFTTLTTSSNLTVGGNLTVTGTSTVVDTVTMNAQNAVIFEGATADNYETTLSIVDPTADHTQYLINQDGYIPVLAAVTTTAITSTPEELNLIDGGTARGTDALASGDGILINDAGTMKMTNVDTVKTFMGTTTEEIQDIVGAMFTSNTETGIAATYEDGDGTIDLVVGTLNQDTTGTAATAATVTTAAQTNITSLGTLTALAVSGDTTMSSGAKLISTSSSSGDYIRLYAGGGTGKWDIYGSGANLRISDNDSAGRVWVDTDFVLQPTKKLWLDGGNDSYIEETSANTLKIYTGGGERMAVSTTGASVTGTLTTSSHVVIPAASRLYLDGSGDTFIEETSANTMTFTTQNSERVRITADGDVGIGCTPGSGTRLEVRDTANSTSLVEISGTDGRGLKLFTQKSNYPTDSGQNDAVVVYNAQDTESSAIYPGHVFQYGGNEVLRLQRIESSGNTGAVGINNNAPAYTLDVSTNGESNAMRILQSTNTKDLDVQFKNEGTGSGDNTSLQLYTPAGAGDPYIRLSITGNEHYDLVLDNSDADKFKILNQSTTRMTMYGNNIHFNESATDSSIYLGSTGGQFGGNNTTRWRSYEGWSAWGVASGDGYWWEVAGAEKMRLDTQGYVGIGVIPETSAANDNSGIFVGGLGGLWGKTTAAAAKHTTLSNNVYDHPSTGQAAIVTDEGSKITLNNGTLQLTTTSAATTADAAHSWNYGLNINNKGNVGVNIVYSDYRMQINGSTQTMNDGTGACLTINSTDNQSSMVMLGCAADINAAGIGYNRQASRLWMTAGGGSENANTAAFCLNGAGQVGIGKIPETEWDSAWKVLQVGAGAMAATSDHSQMSWSQNGKARGASSNSSWERIETGAASQYVQDAGNMYWKYAASASADVGISWTQFMASNTSGTISGDFNDTSDIGLKENITDLTGGLSIIKQLKPRNFDWKEDGKGTGVAGFVAQEVETILPKEVVGDSYSETDTEKGIGKAINVTGIVAHMAKAIQELEEKLNIREGELEQRVLELEQRLI